MKALVDLNVILDVLLAREPHAANSARALALAERGAIDGCICATSVDTLFYLLKRATSGEEARRHVITLLSMLTVLDVTEPCIRRAIDSAWPDLEDAIVYQSARAAGVDVIVTRDLRGFASGALPLLAPAELVAAIRAADA